MVVKNWAVLRKKVKVSIYQPRFQGKPWVFQIPESVDLGLHNICEEVCYNIICLFMCAIIGINLIYTMLQVLKQFTKYLAVVLELHQLPQKDSLDKYLL